MKVCASLTATLGVLILAACSPGSPGVEDRPAETAPIAETAPVDGRAIIADIGRINTPNGIEESYAARIGGVDQWLSIRGKDRDNPVILLVHGGPGSAELAIGWTFQRGWEDYFTVVQWDQRGAGKTFSLNDPETVMPTLSVERMTADVVEVADHLRQKLGKEKIILLGHSWGTIIGLEAVMQRPDMFAAYVAHGQVISMQRNEEEGFRLTMAAAKADGNADAVAALESLEPYPGDLTVRRIGDQRTWSIHYGGLAAYRENAAPWFRAMRLSPEYDDAVLRGYDTGSLGSITALMPELRAVSLDHMNRSPVPIFLLNGRQDLTTPPSASAAWLDALEAPVKASYWFEHSAHLAFMEEPGKVLITLVTCIRPYAVEPDMEAARAAAAGCVHED
ncbi:MAG: alpha/beta hydrolase [Alphaproteobacteria bacterium HGW-Alphaproteobacteria-18]|nr:MAG: alpha/beta hydrolase [Alphaproteobacteria bacterium HGW-Alphaproteobacteria-18]